MGTLLLLGVDVVAEIRWNFTVKGDWGRLLEIRLSDRPVHDAKWLFLMAAMKVELKGLKGAA